MKRIFNGNARTLAMDMLDVHYIAIYGDLIATKVQGCGASSESPQYRSYDIRKDSIYHRSSHFLSMI